MRKDKNIQSLFLISGDASNLSSATRSRSLYRNYSSQHSFLKKRIVSRVRPRFLRFAADNYRCEKYINRCVLDKIGNFYVKSQKKVRFECAQIYIEYEINSLYF